MQNKIQSVLKFVFFVIVIFIGARIQMIVSNSQSEILKNREEVLKNREENLKNRILLQDIQRQLDESKK